MKVSDIMRTPVPTVSPNMTWRQAAELLAQNNISAAPVIENGKLVGILSEKDLFRGLFPVYGDWIMHPESYLDFDSYERDGALDASRRTVDEVMSRNIITASPDTPVLKIGALMVARGVHQVPVVENGNVVGMVQRGKIYTSILRERFGVERKK
jgi:CBS domain-containing protein